MGEKGEVRRSMSKKNKPVPQILVSWVGKADLEGASSTPPTGPLYRILSERPFDVVILLHNQAAKELKNFLQVLGARCSGVVDVHAVTLSSPIHFGDIYTGLDRVLTAVVERYPDGRLTLQLSSGTSAMTAVSILLGKTKYPAQFIQSSREQGVQDEEIPFDIAADFLPALTQRQDRHLKSLMAAEAPSTAAFGDILTRNPAMERLKRQAAILAQRDLPVLIYGETGTGKELFAKAIRNSSARADKPFLVLNCGAIPADLVDATLFGHVKGAFTGATTDSKGYFEQSDGGTLFLDEFGELPLSCQVRLLRVLQDGTFSPVGSTRERKVDVRIIAATHKDLVQEVAAGRFREDLFYRVAIGVLRLPPLRQRTGDVLLLADRLLDKINRDAAGQAGYTSKKLSAKTKKFMQSYPWPGNVRELYATLLRASLWQSEETLSEADLKDALLSVPSRGEGIMDRAVEQGIDLNEILDEVRQHYIDRALSESGGNKSKAAQLLGLNNYQTLSHWIEKLGME